MESNRQGKWILAALFCAWLVSYIDRTAISLALVHIGQDLNLNATQLGLAISAFFVGYALMQIPGGLLADKFGSKRLIITAVIVWSVFTALSGLAWSLASLIIIRILFGIGEGMYPAASTKAVATYFAAEKRTKAQSIMMSSNMLGGAVAPLVVAPLLVVLGWRHVFLTISLLGIFIIIWFYFATKKAKTFVTADQQAPNKNAYKKLLKSSTLWKILLVFFFINIANWGLFSWMPTYLMNVYNVNMAEVGIYSAIPAVIATLGMLLSGSLITKLGLKSKYVVIVFSAGLAGMLFLMSSASSIALVICYQTVAMIFISFIVTFIFTAPHRLMSQQVVASAFGIINFGGQAAGILSPTIMGSLISATGGNYQAAFIFLAISCFVACIVACTLPSKKNTSSISLTSQQA